MLQAHSPRRVAEPQSLPGPLTLLSPTNRPMDGATAVSRPHHGSGSAIDDVLAALQPGQTLYRVQPIVGRQQAEEGKQPVFVIERVSEHGGGGGSGTSSGTTSPAMLSRSLGASSSVSGPPSRAHTTTPSHAVVPQVADDVVAGAAAGPTTTAQAALEATVSLLEELFFDDGGLDSDGDDDRGHAAPAASTAQRAGDGSGV